ncbi:MAG TPA: hypothetical protein VH274_07005, partial [Mycobacteriales bacterium]|nr:hypothetical protein [Mycobacteriales bacterium]
MTARLVVVAALSLAAGVTASPVLAAAETVSAHVATAHPVVGQSLEIDGQVTGASSSPSSTVTVTRDDSTGQ